MIIEAFKNKIFPLSNPDYYLSILQKRILYQEVVLVVIVKISHQGVLLQPVQEVVWIHQEVAVQSIMKV